MLKSLRSCLCFIKHESLKKMHATYLQTSSVFRLNLQCKISVFNQMKLFKFIIKLPVCTNHMPNTGLQRVFLLKSSFNNVHTTRHTEKKVYGTRSRHLVSSGMSEKL